MKQTRVGVQLSTSNGNTTAKMRTNGERVQRINPEPPNNVWPNLLMAWRRHLTRIRRPVLQPIKFHVLTLFLVQLIVEHKVFQIMTFDTLPTKAANFDVAPTELENLPGHFLQRFRT
jgi:hypothetical protein